MEILSILPANSLFLYDKRYRQGDVCPIRIFFFRPDRRKKLRSRAAGRKSEFHEGILIFYLMGIPVCELVFFLLNSLIFARARLEDRARAEMGF